MKKRGFVRLLLSYRDRLKNIEETLQDVMEILLQRQISSNVLISEVECSPVEKPKVLALLPMDENYKVFLMEELLLTRDNRKVLVSITFLARYFILNFRHRSMG